LPSRLVAAIAALHRWLMATPAHILYCDDARFDAHQSPPGHPEQPARLAAVRRGLIATLAEAQAELVPPREANPDELIQVHTAKHVEGLERALRGGGSGHLDGDTFFAPGTRHAAWLAAGAAAELGQRLARATEPSAFVLNARPPGHHATREQAMGFCLLNNVAVAAASALAAGAERVAILDWDVHHGNGTQAIFEADPRVLFISLHEWPQYPGTGRSEEVGRGDARGNTVNLPLPSGSGAREYGAAMRSVVLPRLGDFRPDVLLVSCGFDAHEDDPLGGMQLCDADYGAFTTSAWQAAAACGTARLGVVLEGGYDLGALERASRAVGRALLGEAFELGDGGAPSARAQLVIDATRRAHDRV
jgi:acetoin utilization deacetylase AcuC-like enzyme